MAEGPSRGIAWAGLVNLVGGATGSLIGLVLAAVVGRQLGTEGAGSYFVVVAAVMIVSNVAELGADTGLVRFVSAARATGRSADIPRLVAIAVRPVAMGGVVVVAAAACWVALPGPAATGVDDGLVVAAAAAAVLASMIAVVLAVARGMGDVVSYPLLQGVGLPVLRLVAVLTVVTAGGGVLGALAAWMSPVPLVLGAACLVVLRATRRHATTTPVSETSAEHDRRLRRDFWSFSAVRGVSATVEILLEWADVILVGALTSAEAAGVYAVVTRCARAGEVVQQAARVAVGPQVSAALARGAVREAGEIYGLVTAAMIWMAWPFFIVLAVFSDSVLAIFGEGFAEGARALTVLSVAMALATAAGTVQTILLMGGRSSWQLGDKTAALAVNLVLDLVLVPVWGIEGAAVAWAVTILLDTALVVYQVQWLMGLRPAGRHLVVAAGLSVAVVGTVAAGGRLLLGSSLPAMLVVTAVAALAYLVASIPLRSRLGLTDLVRHRSGA
ncbi:lipopolysaccharide biosynthesis protein [Aeromicrobium endophyticum]|uniref:Lipopolysaccharide biosynthesis protein n=1 Tax=Aeromicrobium endophyticum TaxID=2292704 RepID=A0A371PD25_9ACTN|nr:lipopolysaccharide biosynthesis protein [Aeromicrobium endophyticum]REK73841.1 lipopolysaccharide biosynthesis protein [Aeromicrobium endophyticum]